MEAYPPEYVEHNLPLVLLSGLGERHDDAGSGKGLVRQESGTRIAAASPKCGDERAEQLLDQFLRLDGTDLPWNASALPGPAGALKYKMTAVGRVGMAIWQEPDRATP